MMKRRMQGMSIPELMISLGILLLVLGLATALFTRAFRHQVLTGENLSNEQIARVAMSRINSSLSQATVESNPTDFPGTPAPAVTGFPQSTSAPAITFFRVASLDPAAMPSPAGAPWPDYKTHIISFDAGTGTVNEYVVKEKDWIAGIASPPPTVLARNVVDFSILMVNNNALEYQFTLTINDIINPRATEAPFTLSDNVHIMN